jgi:hypothetical protein
MMSERDDHHHKRERMMDINTLIAKLVEIADVDDFTAAEAVHAYCSLNHEGQWSKLYRLLSQSEFRPGPLWSEAYVDEFVLELVPEAILRVEAEEEVVECEV